MKRRKKLKVLPSSIRERHRYIAFQVISNEDIMYSDLESSIWNVMLDFLGECGVSKTSMWIMKDLYDEKRKIGVIRCNHKSVPQIIATLGLISRLGDTRITIKILKVSGTIKSIKEKIYYH